MVISESIRKDKLAPFSFSRSGGMSVPLMSRNGSAHLPPIS